MIEGHTITRLSFHLPPFARASWVSAYAQSIWQPRFSRIAMALRRVTGIAVAKGLLAPRHITVPLVELKDHAQAWEAQGLTLGAATVGIASPRLIELSDRKELNALTVTVAIRQSAATSFSTSIDETGMDEIDVIWRATASFPEEAGVRMVHAPWVLNPFWLTFGLDLMVGEFRNFEDKTAIELAMAMVDLARKSGFDEEMTWLSQVLRWPIEWSALHGIAETKTPVVRTITDSLATGEKLTVRWAGEVLPSEAAQGHEYALKPPKRRVVTEGATFRRGLREIGVREVED